MSDRHHVLISLASNHEHDKNLSAARAALSQFLCGEAYTDAIYTEPEGGKPSPPVTPYLNQLVAADTPLAVEELTARLKQTELLLGRTDDMRRRRLVPIDLDLLLFDGVRYHERDWQRSYIKKLLTSPLLSPQSH